MTSSAEIAKDRVARKTLRSSDGALLGGVNYWSSLGVTAGVNRLFSLSGVFV
jgi:hypothetical protein